VRWMRLAAKPTSSADLTACDHHMSLGARIASCVGLLVGGFAFGVMGAFTQAYRLVFAWNGNTVVIPWGVVLTLVFLFVFVRGAAWLILTRWAGASLFVGWIFATLVMAVESPSGDLALSAGGRQMAYLFAGAVIGAASATFPLRESRIQRTADVR